jgi:cytochrome b561
MNARQANPNRYCGVAMAFHWSSVALVLALFASGALMTRLTPGSADQFSLYQLHKALGVSLLLLTVARVLWRLVSPRPPTLHHSTRAVALVVHITLYGALLVVPVVGWALVSVSTFAIPTRMFGIATWPHLPVLADLDPIIRASLEPVLSRAHTILAYAFIALVLFHSAAAIRGGRSILARMVPGLPPTRKGSA